MLSFPSHGLLYKGKKLSGLIHHSDRGVQYASYAYTARLKDCQIRISMTESGNPKDNTVAERVNNTLKNELLKGMVVLPGVGSKGCSKSSRGFL